MARKTSAAAVTTATHNGGTPAKILAIAASVNAHLEGAPTRKRARRAKAAPPPPPAKPVIDLANMTAENARRALDAAFPRPTSDVVLIADERATRAALEYLNARDAAAIAEGKKAAAGNVLRFAIGEHERIEGEGWYATWSEKDGTIDWGKLVKELNIPQQEVERFRRDKGRVLNVYESAEEGGRS